MSDADADARRPVRLIFDCYVQQSEEDGPWTPAPGTTGHVRMVAIGATGSVLGRPIFPIDWRRGDRDAHEAVNARMQAYLGASS